MPDDFKKLEGQDGRVIDDPDEIEKEIVDFYKNLYESPREQQLDQDDDFLNKIRSSRRIK